MNRKYKNSMKVRFSSAFELYCHTVTVLVKGGKTEWPAVHYISKSLAADINWPDSTLNKVWQRRANGSC